MLTNEDINILNLIETGDKANIQLAFQLLKAHPKNNVIPLFEELYNWLDKYERIKKVKLIQTKISRILNDRFLLLLGQNNINKLPESIGYCKGTKQIFLDNNNLDSLPTSMSKLELVFDLHLSENNFSVFPKVILELKNLDSLNFRNNFLTEIPSEINQLTKLINLDFRNNKLTKLPESITDLENLTCLLLDNNLLEELPKNIIELKNLSYVSLINNPIPENEINYLQQKLPNCKIVFTPRATIINKRLFLYENFNSKNSWKLMGFLRIQNETSSPFRHEN